MPLRVRVLLVKNLWVSTGCCLGCRGDAFQQGRQQRARRVNPAGRHHLLPSQVKAFYGDEAESILISNLKRGVVSLLQLQPHAGTAVEVGAQLGPDPAQKPGTVLQQESRPQSTVSPGALAEEAKFRLNVMGFADPVAFGL